MRSYLAAAVAALSLTVAATSAEAQSRVRAGALTCNMATSVGFIIGSRQQVSCTFTPRYGPVERYNGHISRLGLDLGITAGGRMIWGVFARTSKLPPRTLAGTYVGASTEATLGVGLGANWLIGGSRKGFALQPWSVQGQVGLNYSVAFSGLTLE